MTKHKDKYINLSEKEHAWVSEHQGQKSWTNTHVRHPVRLQINIFGQNSAPKHIDILIFAICRYIQRGPWTMLDVRH